MKGYHLPEADQGSLKYHSSTLWEPYIYTKSMGINWSLVNRESRLNCLLEPSVTTAAFLSRRVRVKMENSTEAETQQGRWNQPGYAGFEGRRKPGAKACQQP